MVRPHRFTINPLTAADNAFQDAAPAGGDDGAAARAYAEAGALAHTLRAEGVGVSLFEDRTGASPDSVFPNNWFTTHPDGRVVLCPMYAPNRRQERRDDVVDHLRQRFHVSEVIDLSPAERRGEFLEGTGSVVIDHVQRVAYGSRSHRLTPGIFAEYCRLLGLRPMLFDAVDSAGVPVYHTNVMMSVGQTLAVVAPDLIRQPEQRREVIAALEASGRTIIEIAEHQVRRYAGNVIQLTGARGPVLALSASAYDALRQDQLAAIRAVSRIAVADVTTIERSGGSVRCMLAGIHLPPLTH
ncbi:citrulline utilization hydrolase CtlX [Nesterenkonia sp.]|uniref:citrulline utilization hydrolase CtlX n=1 Tax=Nesterenkonia sp. TaxID=704201 RepID=UPI0026092A7E|nr:arginine deiminase-related protein [Nesterenkonia sp.]